MKKQRIWELDAFRGICILGMIVVHAVLDTKGFGSTGNAVFDFVREWGSLLFILISGICLTLGSKSVRRGLIVFAAGMLCTLVTWGMYKVGMECEGIIIRFGILHSSSDYFPLLPNLGYFFVGIFLGRTLYAEKRSLMPKVNSSAAPIRFLSWCGRQSLFIYLLHQPVLYGVIYLLNI